MHPGQAAQEISSPTAQCSPARKRPAVCGSTGRMQAHLDLCLYRLLARSWHACGLMLAADTWLQGPSGPSTRCWGVILLYEPPLATTEDKVPQGLNCKNQAATQPPSNTARTTKPWNSLLGCGVPHTHDTTCFACCIQRAVNVLRQSTACKQVLALHRSQTVHRACWKSQMAHSWHFAVPCIRPNPSVCQCWAVRGWWAPSNTACREYPPVPPRHFLRAPCGYHQQ